MLYSRPTDAGGIRVAVETAMTARLGPRLFSRRILRGFANESVRLGAFDQLRVSVSTELARFLDDPGLAPPWVAGHFFDELVAVLVALRGRDAARGLGREMMRTGGLLEVLTPIIRFSLDFVGSRPDALFGNLQALASVVSRGTGLAWIAGEGSTGTIWMWSEEKVPESSRAPWEGAFSYAFDLTGTTGGVERAVPNAAGDGCEIHVRWD